VDKLVQPESDLNSQLKPLRRSRVDVRICIFRPILKLVLHTADLGIAKPHKTPAFQPNLGSSATISGGHHSADDRTDRPISFGASPQQPFQSSSDYQSQISRCRAVHLFFLSVHDGPPQSRGLAIMAVLNPHCCLETSSGRARLNSIRRTHQTLEIRELPERPRDQDTRLMH
jgi:hypothetical protein